MITKVAISYAALTGEPRPKGAGYLDLFILLHYTPFVQPVKRYGIIFLSSSIIN